MNIASNVVLRAAAAAEYVGLSVSTLRKMRVRGDGPTYVKLGRHSVGYILDDLNIWRNDRRRRSTSDNGPVPLRADPAHILELVDVLDRALCEKIAMRDSELVDVLDRALGEKIWMRDSD